MNGIRRTLAVVVAAGAILGLLVGPAEGWHWRRYGWRDLHIRYPKRPSGYSEILKVFGQPCSRAARKVWADWRAWDDGVWYHLHFHRKLGGRRTSMVSDKGGRSTNLDNDVWGHINNAHLRRYVKSGIWGYNCRYIAGTRKWSTHAWGIAVDVSARYDPNGQCYSTTNRHHAPIWRKHRWVWGKRWCDAMHFQYARNY